jgi:hypothetical protein
MMIALWGAIALLAIGLALLTRVVILHGRSR